MQLDAPFGLGFPSAPALLCLNLAAYEDSQAHSTKGTPSPSRALTACRSTVSGSLSLPSRGPFHLSLTVLCAIGSRHVFSLGGWSPLLPSGFLVSRRTWDLRPSSHDAFGYGAFTPSGRPSQTVRLESWFLTRRGAQALHRRLPLPPRRNGPVLGTPRVWAPPRSLAATWGISF